MLSPRTGRPDWLSTTGRDTVPAANSTNIEANEDAEGIVQLVRVPAPNTEGIPEVVCIGGAKFKDAVTVGRHKDNDAVLEAAHRRAVSKIHCQLALRTFRLQDLDDIHEALFVRDVSKGGTLVNGTPVSKPWHWLQDGDLLGFHSDAKPPEVVHFYKVLYRCHQRLPEHLVTIEEIDPATMGAAAASGPSRPPSSTGASKQKDAKASTRGPAKSWDKPGRAQARQREAAHSAGGKTPKIKAFGAEICGRVVDVTYTGENKTYRMRVKSYNKKMKWHVCDSEGLSSWDGESFDDILKLTEMYHEGALKFVDEAEPGEPAGGGGDTPADPPAKRARH